MHSERKREAAVWLGLDRSGGVETGQRGLRAARLQAGWKRVRGFRSATVRVWAALGLGPWVVLAGLES